MKKFGIVLMVGILALAMCACAVKENLGDGHVSEELVENEEVTEPAEDVKSESVEEVLMSVLNNERTLITELGDEVYLNDYTIGKGTIIDVLYADPMQYAFVDFDQDGKKEMVIDIHQGYGARLVLRYSEKKVFGYEFGIRGLNDIRVDGSFIMSGGAAINGVGHLVFNDNKATVIEDAFKDDLGGEYTLAGQEVERAVVHEYIEKRDQLNRPLWVDCNPED